jgi:hypothetical protein
MWLVVTLVAALLPAVARGQVPAWLSPESAASLDLGFPVLVPADVPAPFSGEPAIDARDGYYSLYWLIPGSPPTYLMITGEVGGTIPDFSYYDRNIQLQVNAEVRGQPAYHDLTPIYDKVYWEENGVVYTVDSKGLAATDSLSLANALIPLAAPAPVDEGGGDQTPPNSGGEQDQTQGDQTQGGTDGAPSTAQLTCPDSVAPGAVAEITLAGNGDLTVDASDGVFPAAPPNTDFDPNAAGGDVVQGQLAHGEQVSLQWQAPDAPLTAYIFVLGPSGDVLVDCAIEVAERGSASEQDSGVIGDGTAIDPRFDAVVEAVLAFDRVRIGDGTGGPDISDAQLRNLVGAPDVTLAAPTPTATATKPTPTPTPTLAPATDPNGMVALEIGPEGGQLDCPAGATLVVPPGALKEPAVVAIRPVADSKLPRSSRVRLVSGTGFDVTFASATGESIGRLHKPANLTVTIPDGTQDRVTLYRVSGTGLQSLSGVAVSGGVASVSLRESARLVAGVPAPAVQPGTERDSLPFILGGLGFLTLVSVVMLFGSAVLRARPKAVMPRRTAPSRVRLR